MAGIQMIISLGQYKEAETYLREAIDVCRKVRNKRGEGPALGFLGLGHIVMGDLETGIKEARESREIAREIGNQFLLVSSFHWSLLGHGSRGSYDKAFKSLEDLSKGANEIGSKHLIAMVPNHYGWIYNELYNFRKAVVHNEAGVDLSQRLEDPECEIFSLLNLVG
ncbi:MAG: tetratricopeptide repeat protein, partial [Desulfobacterales bacterium]